MAQPKHHLADLIDDLATERGWSLREVARRSGLPSATVQKIAGRTAVVVPRRETLEALAYGLSVPVSTLLDAVAKDSGYKPQGAQDVDQPTAIVVAAMEELPVKRREEIAALAMAMLRSERDDQ